ncbi:TetR/AcrR family transcriptional regulator [Catenulispora yoronensis]
MSTARARLVETATRLFYAEGIHTVGIDRIIAEADVAKATFYHHFTSKDDLAVAYLTDEFERQRDAFEGVAGTGAERLRATFTLLCDVSCSPGFRGCAFLNATADFTDPTHPVRAVVAEYRDFLRDHMRTLLTEADHADPDHTADYLLVIRDGMAVSGALGDTAAVRAGAEFAVAVVKMVAEA